MGIPPFACGPPGIIGVAIARVKTLKIKSGYFWTVGPPGRRTTICQIPYYVNKRTSAFKDKGLKISKQPIKANFKPSRRS